MRIFPRVLKFLSVLVFALPMAAQAAYPTKAIRIVVPFGAGGGVDILARTLAHYMESSLGQSIIVENRAGAGGNLGLGTVAKAPPDGYTLVMATTGTQTINPNIYKDLPFDAEKDFSPISLIASVPNVLVVNAKVPAKSLTELIALAKAQPGKLSFASFGFGTSNYLSGMLLNHLADINVLHVPYKSATQAVTDLIAGRVTFAFVNTPLALPHVKAGTLRALAVTGAKRSQSTPDIPTMGEAGLPNFVVESWYGLMAPADTPTSIIQQLHAAVVATLAKPEVIDFFKKQGADVVTTSPSEFADIIKTQKQSWAELIKTTGARIE